jgi:hypothetical protein
VSPHIPPRAISVPSAAQPQRRAVPIVRAKDSEILNMKNAILKNIIKKYMSRIGQKGGAAGTGTKKARTAEQCRKAQAARWAKRSEK